jgi:hypothetical protein
MNPEKEHQAFFNAKAAYEESKTPATEKKLFNTMMPYLKEAANSSDFGYFVQTLGEMDNYGFLEIPACANQIVWTIVGILNKIKSDKNFQIQRFNELFELLSKLNYNRPSLEHSLLLKFFLKRTDNYDSFEQFISWWDIKNLRPDDYQPEQFKDVSFPALAETLYSGLSKSIIANAEGSQPLGTIEKNYLNSLAKDLDELYLQYPQYKFFPYYSAKLRFTAGFTKEAMDTLFPFIRRNNNQFWAWELMGEFFKKEPDMQRAVYCRALLCKADDKGKIGVHARLMELFLQARLFDEAHEELDRIVKIREYNKLRVFPAFMAHKRRDWYLNSTNRRQSSFYYQRIAKDADALFFSEKPVQMAVVAAYLPDRGVAFIVTEDLTNAKFRASKFGIENPEPGMMLEVITETIEGSVEVMQAKISQAHLHAELVQIVEGKIKIITTTSFGIVNGVFVPHELIEAADIKEGDPVIAKALRSYDKKKDNWGWKAISLKLNI